MIAPLSTNANLNSDTEDAYFLQTGLRICADQIAQLNGYTDQEGRSSI